MSDSEFQHKSSRKDELESFFTEPTKDNLLQIFDADGEYGFLDFKRQWTKNEDSDDIDNSWYAKQILGFTNAGGGLIVVGVDEGDEDDDLEAVGVSEPLDDAEFRQKVDSYLPDEAISLYELETYRYNSEVRDERVRGKTFQIVAISGAGRRKPIVSAHESDSIDNGFIYTRRKSSTEVANHGEVQQMIADRVEGMNVELEDDFSQLRTLYDELDNATGSNMIDMLMKDLDSSSFLFSDSEHNGESYLDFIESVTSKKKKQIEMKLNVDSIE
ncbi:RNA-binding domain-containing protein [Halobium palmae]|uniref:RNA-binding domain-containing protein n=1 Tax=Halobium palmae TaxID=1776492 RepID=A0ABD5RWE4_9EURY